MSGPSTKVVAFLLSRLQPTTRKRYRMQILEFSEWDDAHGTCWLEQPEEFQDYLLADYIMDLRDDHGTVA